MGRPAREREWVSPCPVHDLREEGSRAAGEGLRPYVVRTAPGCVPSRHAIGLPSRRAPLGRLGLGELLGERPQRSPRLDGL